MTCEAGHEKNVNVKHWSMAKNGWVDRCLCVGTIKGNTPIQYHHHGGRELNLEEEINMLKSGASMDTLLHGGHDKHVSGGPFKVYETGIRRHNPSLSLTGCSDEA